jgi:hypothetical protein
MEGSITCWHREHVTFLKMMGVEDLVCSWEPQILYVELVRVLNKRVRAYGTAHMHAGREGVCAGADRAGDRVCSVSASRRTWPRSLRRVPGCHQGPVEDHEAHGGWAGVWGGWRVEAEGALGSVGGWEMLARRCL